MYRTFCLFVIVCGYFMGAFADNIQVDGKSYENVYITETDAMYYVQIPQDGTSFSVLKQKVAPENVQIDPDPVARGALFEEFKKNRIKPQTGIQPQNAGRAAARPSIPVPSIQQVEPGGAPRPSANAGGIPLDIAPQPAVPAPVTRADGRTLGEQIDAELQQDLDSGIHEKQSYVDENGTKKLVLKGNYQKDPAREEFVRQYYEDQRLKDEEAAREYRDYMLEQRRIDAEVEKEAIQADIQNMQLEEQRLRSTPRCYGVRYPAYIGLPAVSYSGTSSNAQSPSAPSTPSTSSGGLSFQTLSGTHGGDYVNRSHGNTYGAGENN